MRQNHNHITPLVTVNQIKNCDFTKWFSNKKFSKHSIKSVWIDLEENVIQYLLSDGILLPKDCKPYGLQESSLSDDEDNEYESDSEDQYQPEFPELIERITTSIADLGGEVFPKLNWSAPKDATWINAGSLKCKTSGDIFLLLKSSDFITHDILHAFDNCFDKEGVFDEGKKISLVLRRWCNLLPSMQFRCFVTNNTLVGICQRDCSNFYEFLEKEAPEIFDKISLFFDRVLMAKFPDPSYVVDLYLDRKGRVWIVDFNVFGPPTDTLLFSWDHFVQTTPEQGNGQMEAAHYRPIEAQSQAETKESSQPDQSVQEEPLTEKIEASEQMFTVFSNDACEMRVITSSQRTLSDPYAEFKGPTDTLDLVNGNIDFDSLISLCQT